MQGSRAWKYSPTQAISPTQVLKQASMKIAALERLRQYCPLFPAPVPKLHRILYPVYTGCKFMSSVRRLNKSIYIESRPAAGGAQVIPLCGAVWYTIPYNRQGKRAVYEAEQAIFSPSAGGGVLAGGLAGRSDGHRAGGVFGITGAGAAHLGAAAAKGGFLAAGVLQLRAHFAGFCAGCSGQRALSFWHWSGCGAAPFRCLSAF